MPIDWCLQSDTVTNSRLFFFFFLQANCTCAAISGKGIFHNCCDNDVTMNVLGLRLLPGDPATEMTQKYYDAAGPPAGVLINLVRLCLFSCQHTTMVTR